MTDSRAATLAWTALCQGDRVYLEAIYPQLLARRSIGQHRPPEATPGLQVTPNIQGAVVHIALVLR